MIHGESWAPKTLVQYNSAVSKLLKFGIAKVIPRKNLLPLTKDQLLAFMQWASPKVEGKEESKEEVKPSTLESCLAGLRAWHLFHDKKFPEVDQKTINLVLKAAEELAVTMALVAFWGMARMGENSTDTSPS